MRGVGGSTADREPSASLVDEQVVDEHCRYVPAEPLRRYVAWYTGYRQRGLPPATHRGLPSPYLTLIFTLDEPLTIVAHPDRGQPPGEFRTLLGGLHSVPALITHAGAQSGIQVALRPLGARALLGLPAGELAALDLPAEAVLGGVCAELRDRVRSAAGWPERFAVLDEILLRRAAHAEVAPEVSWAWHELLREGGAIRVSELAAGTGWSERHLTGRFRAEIGLAPKAAARVIRFDRRWRLPARGPGRRLRLLRPGPPGPGVPRAGGLPAEPVAGRGVPKRPSRELAGRGSLGVPGPVTTPPGRE
jgi:AraC-like DNA-binding protein